QLWALMMASATLAASAPRHSPAALKARACEDADVMLRGHPWPRRSARLRRSPLGCRLLRHDGGITRCVAGRALRPLARRGHATPAPFAWCPPRCAAITPRSSHRQRAGVGRVAPTRRPRARPALPALGCAGHALPADSRETRAA